MSEELRPRLVSWRLDDEIGNDENEWNWIEITICFSDGTKRWSIIYTPQRLHNNLSRKNIDPPGMHIKHMIIVRRYDVEDIDRVLKALDEEDELIEASRSLD
ncbi:hypothetical protein [Paenibacillus turpanensis]|uniref:hypothetical protein n=1 Tax=Paenibacillus turpanensis TaxID=2689078 RepID=UPI0014099D5A|nr:hypothetical protein [Paenibacillus turpanensis]